MASSFEQERAARLHNIALQLLPEAAPEYATVLAKAKGLFIICERLDQPCDLEYPHIDSFLWIKGKRKIQFSQLRDVYLKRCPDQGDIQFKMGGIVQDENLTIGDLPEIKDQIVVISAVKREATPANAAFSNPSSQGSARQPLQPINRQLQTPVKRSADELPVKEEARSPLVPPSQLVFNTAPAPAPNEEPNDEGDANMPEPEYEPRDPGNPFAEQHEELEEPAITGVPLSRIINDSTPERLEAGVEAGLHILSKIEAPLKTLTNEDAKTWLGHIDKVREGAERSRTVVGVVGNTGAGKSSVINAMLDEERLVPTNCMRACTAVVTELSYNYSDDPARKYRAEIEFIQPEDWRKELKVLFEEIFDEGGGYSREISNPDSEAGISYAKVRAVYNTYTREQLANASVDSLMGNKKVKSLLGASKKIVARDSSFFYEKLQQWVDSKEKGSEKLDKNGNKIANKARDFEAWPLIKVVKIYTKSPALSTGACIVDLPGVHDSNAARAAVAQGYMKQCTGLWIVAPINRAVDDKAAKTLLGDTFKRQLKFDGTYSAVTFICSKTDDISRMEAIDSLGLTDEASDLNNKAVELDQQRLKLKAEKDSVKARQRDLDASVEQIEDDIDIWEKLGEDIEDGETVFPPSTSAKKRKAARSAQQPSKRRRRMVDSDDEDANSDQDTSPEPEQEPDDEVLKEPLTAARVDEKLDELKQLKKEARREKRALGDRIEELQNLMDTVDIELAENNAQIDAICINGRNEYSRGAIQQDFAAGIREIDQETAEEEDPDNFDPENDIRDYDKVAKSLPVFCVSSRAYQKLSGRLRRDNDVPGFTDIKETEIPALQAHCKKLTEAGRHANCSRFLNNLKQLLTSLQLWAGDDGTGAKLSAQQRDSEKAWLARKLKELEKALDKTVENTLDDGVETLKEQLFEKFGPAIQSATQEALPKAMSWGNRKENGGLHYSTYKATTRRSGVFAGASGARDFNSDLTEPIYKILGSSWERCFQRRLPTILRSLRNSASKVLSQFHTETERRAAERGLGLARIRMLATQLDAYNAIFRDLCEAAVTTLNEGQKDINREFTPIIMAAMEPAYTACNDERGPGSFARMKGHMTTHVNSQQNAMFNLASEQVRASLLKLCKSIRETMLDRADQIFVNMSRDYMGVNTAEVKLTREERHVRRSVDEAVLGADQAFREVLDQDIEELKARIPLDKDDAAANADFDGEVSDEIMDDNGDESAFEDERRVEMPGNSDASPGDQLSGTQVTAPSQETDALMNAVTIPPPEDVRATMEDTLAGSGAQTT